LAPSREAIRSYITKAPSVIVPTKFHLPNISYILKPFTILNGEVYMAHDVTLRAYVFLDQLQPQMAAYQATVSKGYMPVSGMASMYIELAPGMPINRLTDIALKHTNVRPAELIVERRYGLLEIHHDDQAEVLTAGKAILKDLGLKESDRLKPKVVTNQIIKKIDDYQSMILNRQNRGMMILHDQSLFIMETVPAAYITYAANEAEKAADILINGIRAAGAFGRLYLSGDEADVQAAAAAASAAVENLSGKTWK